MSRISESGKVIRRVLHGARDVGTLLVQRGRRLLLLIAIFGASLYVLGALAEEVAEKEPFGFDRPIMLAVRQYATPSLDQAMLWMSGGGHYLFSYALPAVVTVLFLARQRRREAAYLVLSTLGAMLLVTLIKQLLQRTRPDFWVPIAPEKSFSFPSGHTTGSACAAIALFAVAGSRRLRWIVGVLGFPIALLIAFSRVYLGVHFPSDVLGGWAMALAWTSACWVIVFRKRVSEMFKGLSAAVLLLAGTLTLMPRPVQAQKPFGAEVREWGEFGAVMAGAYLLDTAAQRRLYTEADTTLPGLVSIGDQLGRRAPYYAGLTALYFGSRIAGYDEVADGAARTAAALTINGLVAGGIKRLVGRSRPSNAGSNNHTFDPLQSSWDWESFPSGHTLTAFTAATALALETRSTLPSVAAFGVASMVGWSRLRSNEHWLSDVVTSAILGVELTEVVLPLLGLPEESGNPGPTFPVFQIQLPLP